MPKSSNAKKGSKGSTRPQVWFSSVAVVVSDTKKAQKWYTGPLGLETFDTGEHWVTVGRTGKGGKLHLCDWQPEGKLEPGNSGILLLVPGKEFEKECGKLKANGVAFSEEPKKTDWGWIATIRDPDGNEITLMPEG
jgi:predicted enzyme related to lactoylglutathione lyase